MKRVLSLLFASTLLLNCTSDEKRLEIQMDAILEWIDESGLEFTATGTGLYYHIVEPGDPDRIPDSSFGELQTHGLPLRFYGFLTRMVRFSALVR